MELPQDLFNQSPSIRSIYPNFGTTKTEVERTELSDTEKQATSAEDAPQTVDTDTQGKRMPIIGIIVAIVIILLLTQIKF